MQQKRIKSGLAVTESHLNLIDDNLRKARVKSRNEFVEQAVEHYTAFLSAEEHHEQITNMVSADLEKLFSKFAKTFSTNQYKLAVQLSTLCYLTAYQCDYDYEQIHNLMYHCAEEVKELNSVPNFGKILQNVKEK